MGSINSGNHNTNTVGEIRLYEGLEYVALSAPTLSSSTTFYLPSTDGSNGQVLTTDGSGSLSWTSASSGSDDQTASEVSYSNTSSGLSATTVQAAIDEINTNTSTLWTRDATNGETYTTNSSDEVGIGISDPA